MNLFETIYFLVELKLIQVISTAYCALPKRKSVLNYNTIVDYAGAGVMLTGSIYVLRTFPPQFILLARISIVKTGKVIYGIYNTTFSTKSK